MAWLIQLVDDVGVHKFELTQGSLTLGRHPECEITIDDTAVSARHARLVVEPNPDFPDYCDYYVEDLDSTNGTFINNSRLNGRRRLHHDDSLRIAWNRFKFLDDQEQDLEKTRHTLRS